MKSLNELVKNPSGIDSLNNYIGETEFGDLKVVMTRKRDSGLITRCNWAEALERLGGEGDNVVIHRFGHLACGWWEALCVQGDKVNEGQAIVDELKDYPILNDGAYLDAECEEADEVWKSCYSNNERIEFIRAHRSEFEFYGISDLLGCVGGKYYCGSSYLMVE